MSSGLGFPKHATWQTFHASEVLVLLPVQHLIDIGAFRSWAPATYERTFNGAVQHDVLATTLWDCWELRLHSAADVPPTHPMQWGQRHFLILLLRLINYIGADIGSPRPPHAQKQLKRSFLSIVSFCIFCNQQFMRFLSRQISLQFVVKLSANWSTETPA